MTAFAQFAFTKVLNVCFQVALFGYNGPDEFLGMLLVSFVIGTPVQIILALIKKGDYIMKIKIRKMLDRVQRQKHNSEHATERKSNLAWV